MDRGSGLLLHITSLPSPYGVGDLGPEAYRFADLLADCRQRYWQVLPLNPADPAFGNSPYCGNSGLAGNTLLISPDILMEEGLLSKADLKGAAAIKESRCDYSKVIPYKERLLNRAYERFKSGREGADLYEEFCAKNAGWLDDFALFAAIKRRCGQKAWGGWPKGLRDRDDKELAAVKRGRADEIAREKFLQHLFFRQWSSLKEYCNRKGIQIIGDIPIYVSYDSADVWTDPRMFKLDADRWPAFVAGVPPDYFSKTGQRWGNPVYDWDALKGDGFKWWIGRMEHNLELFDVVRIDHFRGLVAYWQIPASEKTAVNGKWVKVPTEEFFRALSGRFHRLPIIAEDLGLITQDVADVRQRLSLPGMKVLLFAFGEDNPRHPYLPHNYERNCVVYTGTHDNNTIRGWFDKEATPAHKKRLFRYLGREAPVKTLNWELIRLAMMSVADTVIIPVQDVLGLGREARMNVPSVLAGNWEWRLSPGALTPAISRTLLDMTEAYGRAA